VLILCGSVLQYNTIQYNNTHHTKQHTTLKATLYTQYYKKNPEHILYTIKTRKRVEPDVDESVLQTTRYIKQWVNHTIQ